MGNSESSQAPIEWALVPSSRTISRDETLGDIAVVGKLLETFGGRKKSNSVSILDFEGTNDADEPVTLDFLRAEPKFRRIREYVQKDPATLFPVLHEVTTQHPGLVQLLMSRQEEFLALLNETNEDDVGKDPDGVSFDKETDEYEPTQEDIDAVNSLQRLGFEQEKAILAYLGCDRNVHRAADFLLDTESRDDGIKDEDGGSPGNQLSGSEIIPSSSRGHRQELPSLPRPKTSQKLSDKTGDLIELPEDENTEISEGLNYMNLARNAHSEGSKPHVEMTFARQAASAKQNPKKRILEQKKSLSMDEAPHISKWSTSRPTDENEATTKNKAEDLTESSASMLKIDKINSLVNTPIDLSEGRKATSKLERESSDVVRKPPRKAPPIPRKPASLTITIAPEESRGVITSEVSKIGQPRNGDAPAKESQAKNFKEPKSPPSAKKVRFDTSKGRRQLIDSSSSTDILRPNCMCWLIPCPPELMGFSPTIIELRQQIKALRGENKTLKLLVNESHTPKWLTLYRVYSSTGIKHYSDKPVFLHGLLQGKKEVVDIRRHLEENKEIVLLTFRDYNSDQHSSNLASASLNGEQDTSIAAQSPLSIGESFCVWSSKLSSALKVLTHERGEIFPSFELGDEIKAPYLFYYHHRRLFHEATSILPWDEQVQLDVFTSFMDENTVEFYSELKQRFLEGLSPINSFCYLFTPGEILVIKEEEHYLAYKQIGMPKVENLDSGILVRIEVGHYAFDGAFEFQKKEIVVKWRSDTPEFPDTDKKPISSLNIYPIRYADEGVQDTLRERGRKLWSCRHRRYVSYSHQDKLGEHVNARFMVDFPTYRKMHPFTTGTTALRDDLGAAKMASDEPPSEEFTLLLPAHVVGYDMNEKKWVQLNLHRVSDVIWNKQAFEDLVIDPSTKELIQAVVTNQIAAEKSTDLIEKKGAGLIVLLHGGPGVGKTLTAESVAEISEKPLYRVTCGDIGMSPDTIEQYLETVLYLGRLWGCVVLLDEADIFLEQRSLANLERNALVSVFLRILEYYQGIFILTSNRVGVFDEAFKSRIHLTINYEPLTEAQRQQIWKTFFKHLERLADDTVDIAGVEYKINELAVYKMNGRQIRNSITTARQLALYKKQKMGFAHLEHVIKVAARFDKYIEQVHEEISDDQWAREQGVR